MTELLKGVNALPFYVMMSDLVISLSNHPEYYDRAWCRLEMLFAKSSFLGTGFPKMKEVQMEGSSSKLIEHRSLEDDTEWAFKVRPENVRGANLTVEGDRHVISFLSTQAILLQ